MHALQSMDSGIFTLLSRRHFLLRSIAEAAWANLFWFMTSSVWLVLPWIECEVTWRFSSWVLSIKIKLITNNLFKPLDFQGTKWVNGEKYINWKMSAFVNNFIGIVKLHQLLNGKISFKDQIAVNNENDNRQHSANLWFSIKWSISNCWGYGLASSHAWAS